MIGLVLVGLLTSGCVVGNASATGAAGVQAVACSPGGTLPGLSAEQVENARQIAQVALGLGLGRRAALIGILTANVETDLQNLPGGDRDSVGLFQQRDPWASTTDRMDPVKSATMFFTGGQGGQEGLLDIVGWEQLDPGVAMQRVQKSQFAGGSSPGYAGKLAAAFTLTAAVTATCTAAATTPGNVTGLEQNPSQDPSTFGWVRAGPMEPMVWKGHRFGQVAKGTAPLFSAFLDELVPLIPGGLNNYLGAYENRNNVNSPGRASFHAYGLALDINYNVNANGLRPEPLQGRQFALPLVTDQIAKKYGLTWGGSFRGTPDPMHVEAHVTPQQVAAFTQGSTP